MHGFNIEVGGVGTDYRHNVLAAGMAAQPAIAFVEHEPREPRRQSRVTAKLAERTVGAEIRVLKRVFGFGVVTQRRARASR